MTVIDLKNNLKEYYAPSAKNISMVDIPDMNFIMIDGLGAPAGPVFQESIEALYSVAYTIKFAKKKRERLEYPVMALEGLWWANDMSIFGNQNENREQWIWTLMIMQPEAVSKIDFESGREAAGQKKPNPKIKLVRLESFKEGPAVQIMHIGPFSSEGPNVHKLHQIINELGGQPAGKHHEIYLSDFRKTAPEKLKTVLRQPYHL
jgi:hypothetical protein